MKVVENILPWAMLADEIRTKILIRNANHMLPTLNPTFYISFVVRVTNNARQTALLASALQTVALRTSDGDNLGYFYIGRQWFKPQVWNFQRRE